MVIVDELEIGVVEGVLADVVDMGMDAGSDDVASTEEDLYLEEEFFHAKGLGDVVIGADSEAVDAVFCQRSSGEEDDGHFDVEVAYLFGQFEAVHFGEHDVEDTAVEVLGFKGFQGLFSFRVMFDFVVVFRQMVFDDEGERFVVFYQKDLVPHISEIDECSMLEDERGFNGMCLCCAVICMHDFIPIQRGAKIITLRDGGAGLCAVWTDTVHQCLV